ncbi:MULTISPECIES: DUF6931 family protein [Burkholderia]|uniref:DUF6931 family protein n=2 Tax=Burkholderiaceae TaxID=119060 RepID=UPI00046A0A01|nr:MULTISPECIES: hypothetical protein [Burkholderia]MDN7808265.1 hypothetical protein [Burkholderia gladioli]
MSAILDAARQMRLAAPAMARLDAAMSPHAAVRALLDAGLAADALSLLARLLPHRYAVAWVCQCGRGETLAAPDQAGLALAEAWVRDPAEAHRADAAAFAAEHRYRGIGAWAAAAAGWTGGNLNPRAEQPTPPPAHLCAIAAMAALNYLAALVPARFDARRLTYVRDALGLLGTPNGSDGGPR